MVVRTLFILLMTFALAACAQTGHRGSLSKYEKSVVFVENIITNSSIEKGLQEALAEYKDKNTAAPKRLSDKALNEINTLLTREMINNRIRLISKIAILLTAEFTDDEIITLHSLKDFDALKTAQQKIKSNPNDHNLHSKFTQAELKAITDIKGVKNLETILPKLDALRPKIEETGKEIYLEIIIKFFQNFWKLSPSTNL